MLRQNYPDELPYPHFALICIDHDGRLRHKASPSIQSSREAIFSPRVTNAFLQAVTRSGYAGSSHSQFDAGAPVLLKRAFGGQIPPRPLHNRLNRAAPGQETGDPKEHQCGPLGSQPNMQLAIWAQEQKRQLQYQQHSGHKPWDARPSFKSNHKVLIYIGDKDFLHRYYEKVFQNLQQANCRVLAKAYIKLVEPRKQVHYPYNGRKIVAGRTMQLEPDETKPPWWPPGVSHREPDHLPKAERIKLLVHILCELHTSHGVTARRLKNADHPIRRQISPTERLQILDEVYQVREEEEMFQEGFTDGKIPVLVSRVNLPDAWKDTLSQISPGRKCSPTEDTTNERKDIEETIVIRSGPVQNATITQSAFTGRKVPLDLSPMILRASSRGSSQFNDQYLPVHSSSDPSPSSSMSEQDAKRKRIV